MILCSSCPLLNPWQIPELSVAGFIKIGLVYRIIDTGLTLLRFKVIPMDLNFLKFQFHIDAKVVPL